MTNLLERSSNNVSISTFYEEYSVGKYDMNPPYQRLSVWSPEKKSFFIDSILKNLPIPPVFLRQKIDDNTGKTSYEVIDGKQRLTSIVEFIEGVLPTADELEGPFNDEELAGKYFSELNGDYLEKFKKHFWRYLIPIEYIYSGDPIVIDKIFDRLNRNGEKLNGQELRHSNFYSSQLLKLCYEKSKDPFWHERLETTDKNRMEDVEFISELLFVLLEKTELTATNAELDRYYHKYAADASADWLELGSEFDRTTEFLISLGIQYDEFKVYGVSHLYGFWCFSRACLASGVSADDIASRMRDFLTLIRNRDYSVQEAMDYKNSMSNRTKFQGQRRKRKNALLSFCQLAVN
jgi:uncharacterized protein with ParB-like and HNH nuclease domain